MPVDACQYFYECINCKEMIKPKLGDCCVFCSYGTVKCPPRQMGENCCKVSAKTMIAQHDTGGWTNLQELLEYQQYAFDNLKAIIEKQTDEIWQQNITTKEFGTKTKAEAIGRIISHTAYHAGQLAIILKYGKNYVSK